jgi:hypothetical protein
MDQFRQAKCTNSACAASFKVPATFTANKAKCPKCSGVVEVGPVQSAAPKVEPSAAPAAAAAPAAKPVPATVPPPKPAAPKAAPAPAPKPAAPKAPAAAKAPEAKPAAPKAAAPAKPAAPSVRDAAASAASKVKSGATTPPSAKAKKAAEESEGEGKRPRHVHKEKSKTPMILSVVGLLVFAAAAGWWFGVKMPADEQAKKEASDALAKQKREAAEAQAAKDKAEMEAADAARLASAAAAEAAKGGGDAPASASGSSNEGTKPAEKPADKKSSVDSNIVDDIDLTAFPELPKQSSCTDEQWTTLQADARTLIDPAAGAKGARAAKRLQEAGRIAVPALLNQFRTINPATDDGRKAGDLIQKTLERICNGRNFGWQYTTELKDVVYNKKAIKNWFKIWETVGEDEQQWLGFTKQLNKDGEGAKPADSGKAASGLDDF